MNILAIDIGNTNISIGLFIDGTERRIETVAGTNEPLLVEVLEAAWSEIPMSTTSKKPVRDGRVIVSSVKPAWTEQVGKLAKDNLGEKIMLIGPDVPLPMEMKVDAPERVGTDRVAAAAAAWAVVEQALVVADFGTAITIDMVDDNGAFLGGIIAPGIGMGAKALNEFTAKLPLVKTQAPDGPWGTNTESAINNGLYFGAVGLLNEVVRRYAEKIEKWPYTVITGGDAGLIHKDCEFVDAFVPYLTIKGIALAYRNYLDAKQEQEDEEE
jgi:type III pantothenate kinase